MSIHNIYEQRQNFFLTPNSTARGGIYFCVLVGLVSFGAGLMLQGGEHATRTWGSFLFNLLFFFAIALGGSAFAAMQDVIGAKWGRPIMRVHESFASFLPVAAILLAIFFGCILAKVGHADAVYTWIKDPNLIHHYWGKRDWLKPVLMVGRDVFALVVILVLAGWQLKHKLRRDMALVNGEKQKAMELGLEVQAKLRYWSAPILVVYSLAFSLLAFDLLMSLAPTWFSTLWGGWAFAVMMQTLMASILLAMFSLRRTHVGQYFRRLQFHDVGKLMHGFTIFFAYLTYAHVLTYWYGNMPEETQYFLKRMQGPWLGLIIVAPILSFLVPFFALIPRPSKWTAGITIPLAACVLFAQWLTYLIVVIPETVETAKWGLPWIEVGLFLGFLGLFLSSVFWFGRRFPMLAVADPLLHDALADEHH